MFELERKVLWDIGQGFFISEMLRKYWQIAKMTFLTFLQDLQKSFCVSKGNKQYQVSGRGFW